MSKLIEVPLTAWLVWVSGNLLLLVVSALFIKPSHPCFNGFVIIIPTWLHDVLTPTELAAVVAHEEGHRQLLHVWENLARSCLFRRATAARRLAQELESDDFAVAAGHGAALASALSKLSTSPADNIRIQRLSATP